jgi:hypothetical protein
VTKSRERSVRFGQSVRHGGLRCCGLLDSWERGAAKTYGAAAAAHHHLLLRLTLRNNKTTGRRRKYDQNPASIQPTQHPRTHIRTRRRRQGAHTSPRGFIAAAVAFQPRAAAVDAQRRRRRSTRPPFDPGSGSSGPAAPALDGDRTGDPVPDVSSINPVCGERNGFGAVVSVGGCRRKHRRRPSSSAPHRGGGSINQKKLLHFTWLAPAKPGTHTQT